MVRIRVDWRTSLNLTGRVLLYLAAPLCFPLAVAVYYGDPVVPFLAAILTTLAVGGALRHLLDDPGEIGPAFGGAGPQTYASFPRRPGRRWSC